MQSVWSHPPLKSFVKGPGRCQCQTGRGTQFSTIFSIFRTRIMLQEPYYTGASVWPSPQVQQCRYDGQPYSGTSYYRSQLASRRPVTTRASSRRPAGTDLLHHVDPAQGSWEPHKSPDTGGLPREGGICPVRGAGTCGWDPANVSKQRELTGCEGNSQP